MRGVGSILLVLLAAPVGAMELTKENWDTATAGKTVFIKFLAPWWGHCKKLKPDWDALMSEFKDSKTALIADVDCTAAGKELCSDQGIRGYPTIKYGDPSNLEDYKGGRTLSALKEFASQNLGPTCGPANLDLCSDEMKTTIQGFQAMTPSELSEKITEQEVAMEKLETDFKSFVEGLNKQYQEETKKKDEASEEIKKSGLGLMKAVKAHMSKDKTEL